MKTEMLFSLTENFCSKIRKNVKNEGKRIKKELETYSNKNAKHRCPLGCTKCCTQLFKTVPYEYTKNNLKKIFEEAIEKLSLKKEYLMYLKKIKNFFNTEKLSNEILKNKRDEFLSIVLPVILNDIKEENKKLTKKGYFFDTKKEFNEKIKELIKIKNISKKKIIFKNCLFITKWGCAIHNKTRPKECEEFFCENILKNFS